MFLSSAFVFFTQLANIYLEQGKLDQVGSILKSKHAPKSTLPLQWSLLYPQYLICTICRYYTLYINFLDVRSSPNM